MEENIEQQSGEALEEMISALSASEQAEKLSQLNAY